MAPSVERVSCRVIGRERCDEALVIVRLTRPPTHVFKPGQWFALTLNTRDGVQTKPFSYASAPGDAWIELATRPTGSPFKDALLALERDAELLIAGPYGGPLVLERGVTPVAFIAGGVGVTPARSNIRHAVQREQVREMALLYGNRSPRCVPYRDELRRYADDNPWFRLIEVFEEPDPSWDGPQGEITPELIASQMDDVSRFVWFVSGPPGMVEAMRASLRRLGVADAGVAIESFAGYTDV